MDQSERVAGAANSRSGARRRPFRSHRPTGREFGPQVEDTHLQSDVPNGEQAAPSQRRRNRPKKQGSNGNNGFVSVPDVYSGLNAEPTSNRPNRRWTGAMSSSSSNTTQGQRYTSSATYENHVPNGRTGSRPHNQWNGNGRMPDRPPVDRRPQNQQPHQQRAQLRPIVVPFVVDDGDPESQRKRLEELLRQESFECMICCEDVRSRDQVWTCFDSCHNIFHLRCISKWACANVPRTDTSVTDPGPKKGWRCPTCQNEVEKIPNKYFCFCGKKRNPDPMPELVPHSCGQICSKRKNASKTSRCVHRCQLLCHPGACPACDIGITENCCCGRTSKPVACGTSDRTILTCDNVCGKLLACNKHTCARTCHPGLCDLCDVQIESKCFCGRDQKKVTCDPGAPAELPAYSCGKKCHKKLECGNHLCNDLCHDGPCAECRLSPGIVDSCPCGKKPICDMKGKERTKCTDPVPVCGAICDKSLRCGPLTGLHKCAKNCHNGTCGPCKLKTSIQCQCAATLETIECKSLKDRVFVCNRRCNKKLSCGRHKCQKSCCKKDDNHVCTMTCQKKLSCGRHKCAEVCHPGSCPTCWNVSWQELSCACGAEVLLPPIACGAQVPACRRPCTRRHACNHPVDHTCHQDASCPPCTYGMARACFGKHTTMNNVLCCLPGVSCGKACGKQMACGVHVCQRACHDGSCGDCNYSCTKVRPCGHLCNQTCHELTSPNACPSVPCRVMLTVYCSCKRLSDKRSCDEINHQNHRLPVTLLARLRIAHETEVDVNSLIREGEVHKYIRLECDAKCSQMERNRNLADALNICNAEINPDGVKYSESLKQAYLHYPEFVRETYTTLSQLVKGVEHARHKGSFHNFPAMRQDLRAIVHELAEVFKCSSHSVDQEPRRSVSVKAIKDRSIVPAQSLMDVMKNRIPGKTGSNFTTLVKSSKVSSTPLPPASKPVAPKDYFDFDGDD